MSEELTRHLMLVAWSIYPSLHIWVSRVCCSSSRITASVLVAF
jgi:hypothetical protein